MPVPKLLHPLRLPPHEVWVSYGLEALVPNEPCSPCQWELVGLAFHDGEPRLCHAYDTEGYVTNGPTGTRPLVECMADIRLKAVPELEKLHERIVKTKEEYVPKVDAAVKQLRELLARI